jgi:type I restriction enzyme S subunit
MGQAPPGTSYNQEGNGYPLLAGAGDFGEMVPRSKKHTTAPSRVSKEWDLLLCIRASIGDLNWSNDEYCLGRGVAGLRPVEGKLDRHYLWHFVSAKKNQLAEKGTGSTFKQVNRSHISEWLIPLPSMPEQKRIATILGKAESLHRNRRKSIELSGDFLRSVFLEMFGDPGENSKNWARGTIRDLLSEARYGTSGKADIENGEFPILRMGNLTYSGSLDLSNLKYIDIELKDQEKYLVRNGDLLFNRTNSKELVGKTAVYDRKKPMAVAGYLIRLRPNERGNSYYISGYLNSAHGKTTLLSICKSIVGMANINAQEVQNIPILIPPVELQNKFERITKVVKTGLKRHGDSLQKIDELFASLRSRAFLGQL